MRNIAFFLFIAIVAACSKKQDEPKPAPTSPPTVTAKPIENTETTVAVTPNVTCDKLVTTKILGMYFQGATVEAGPIVAQRNVECVFKLSGKALASLMTTCGDAIGANKDAAIADLKRTHPNTTDIADVGKGGVTIDLGDMHRAVVWDDDSACQVTFNVPKTVDARALAKDVLANLP